MSKCKYSPKLVHIDGDKDKIIKKVIQQQELQVEVG